MVVCSIFVVLGLEEKRICIHVLLDPLVEKRT